MTTLTGADERRERMDWVQILFGSLISTSSVVAIAVFVGRESFGRLLDARLERFKHDLQVEATTRELTLQSQIAFKERQVSELYGPIYAMLKRGRTLVRLWREGKLAEVEASFWSLAFSTNETIETLILDKSHLIEGDHIPDSFIQFLTHVPIWHWFGETAHHVPTLSPEEFPEAYYSEQFERDIYQTTERLKRELHELYRRFGLVAPEPDRLGNAEGARI
jgi:hypothetical protein